MHSKLKGDIGELIVAAELLQRGWHIAFPYGENLKYDLIVEKDNLIQRIQVKAVFPRNGTLRINCRSSNNWSVVSYEVKDFECLAAVDLSTKKVYFIPSKKMKRNMVTLRLTEPLNTQNKKINFAKNFIKFPN